MAERRKAAPVTLTTPQRERPERLWLVYGNHSFISRVTVNSWD